MARLVAQERRGASRRIACAAILAAAWSAGVLRAAQGEPGAELATSVLVIPNKPIAVDAGPPNAADFRATVGHQAYQVRSVSRAAESKDLKIRIVFDMSSTAPEDRACLLEQARAVWRELRARRGLEVLIVSSAWSETHGNIGLVDERAYQYFLPGSVQEKTCLAFNENQRGWGSSSQFWGDAAVESFRGLVNELEKERGPDVVIWVGQTFHWVRTWSWRVFSAESGSVIEDRARAGESAVYPWLDGLTKAGVSVFPVVWLNGRSGSSLGPQESMRSASEIAGFLGGRVSVSDRDLAPGIKKILEGVGQGLVLEIAGPAVGWRSDGSAETLEMWTERDRAALDVKRQYVRLAELTPNMTMRHGYPTLEPMVPLFDTEWLRGKAGCSVAPEAAATRWMMTALTPGSVGRRGDGLPTLVEFVAKGPGPAESADERLNLKSRQRTQAVAAGPEGFTEVCVNLPPTTATDGDYRVIVFDPDTKWSGVGILPLSEVLEYQRKHGLRAGGGK